MSVIEQKREMPVTGSPYRKTRLAFFWRQLELWSERRRQRLALRRLDDRALSDLGLSRADVEAEAGKPFWKP